MYIQCCFFLDLSECRNRLQVLFYHTNALLLQDFSYGITNVLGIRYLDPRFIENAIQNKLGGNTARQTDSEGHS